MYFLPNRRIKRISAPPPAPPWLEQGSKTRHFRAFPRQAGLACCPACACTLDYGSPPNGKKLDGLFRDPASDVGQRYQEGEFRDPVPKEIGWMPWINNKNVSADLQASQPGIYLNLLDRPGGQPYLSVANDNSTAGVSDKGQFQTHVMPAAKLHRDQVIAYYCDCHAEVVRVKQASDYVLVAPAMPDAQ